MAPAVSLEHDRLHASDWSGADVDLDEVLRRLSELRASRPRNTVMNLLAMVSDDEMARRATSTAAELGVKHPSRTIVVRPMPEGPDRIDAAIRTHGHALVDGAPVQYEEVTLQVWGKPALHLYSLVEPLLTSDVRTHLWWLGTPPWESHTFLQVLEDVDTLVVDSGIFERPYESFIALARVADTMHDPQGVADFQWSRLKPWREALAQVFAPRDRQAFLRGISALGLDYTGEGRGNRSAAALLAGWLIRSLGWELQSATGMTGGSVRAFYRAPAGHPVEIAARSVATGAAGEGRIAALRIEAVAQGQTCRLEIVRDRDELERAVLRLEIGGAEAVRSEIRLGLATAPDSVLLSDVLVTGRRDPIYLESMTAAATLLSAFK